MCPLRLDKISAQSKTTGHSTKSKFRVFILFDFFCRAGQYKSKFRVFILFEFFAELDDTICQLLHQSSAPTYGGLTQDAIHEEYVRQELKREWNEFKHNVVVDVINTKGIRPGFGKWAK